MRTEIVAGAAALARAVELLRAGELVALPTETVYGLAADSLNIAAVTKIFEVKERPRFDPLIVHLPTRQALEAIADVDPPLVSALAQRFWPGPFTIVLPRRDPIPDLVTAGMQTVAVRMSAHPLFSSIVRHFGAPVAAPSANRFGRISPTTAQHVKEELNGRIPLIVDGGDTLHGIESTIVRVVNNGIEILRQGPITAEMLAEFAPVRAAHVSDSAVLSPGQLPTHYAPRTKLMLVEDLRTFQPPEGKRVGALSFQPQPKVPRFVAARSLSATGDLTEAAAKLFAALRQLDEENLDLLVAEKVPNRGIGAAINDRLRRAAT